MFLCNFIFFNPRACVRALSSVLHLTAATGRCAQHAEQHPQGIAPPLAPDCYLFCDGFFFVLQDRRLLDTPAIIRFLFGEVFFLAAAALSPLRFWRRQFLFAPESRMPLRDSFACAGAVQVRSAASQRQCCGRCRR
jgi:hypothetical protein